ncbi:mediator of RNA polymerase II transcription subunit 1-domain-containing protein [Scheffersomyces amazonensis]|uniref:mediator of RNA polymerase II transcription subunit 1-domain-containing protein n=1 Tax=Scheffersomyces amazonensis TaxID=1078765 RepID=UPI00315CF9FE
MSSNGVLVQPLESLYDYSPNFKVSVELIQKLAQQLKLETFVDKSGYTIDSINAAKNEKIQRLSIAGSYVLLEIDFIDDETIVNVSLSFANQETEAVETLDKNLHGKIISKDKDETGIYQVIIDSSQKSLAYSKGSGTGTKSIAEGILLKNLTSKKLNNFPTNLSYLANMDRLSSASFDAFDILERLSMLLYAVETIETENKKDDWLVDEGFVSRVGAVKVNDEETNQLGVFIHYWQDFRYINHEYKVSTDSKIPLVGFNHGLLIRIDPVSTSKQVDYFEDLKTENWDLHSSSKLDVYKFKFGNKSDTNDPTSSNLQGPPSSSSSSSSTTSAEISNWELNLVLDQEVFIPSYLLGYLAPMKYTTGTSQNPTISQFNNYESAVHHLHTFDDKEIPFNISSDLITNDFIPVKTMFINKLVEISYYVPMFRNHIVLVNLFNTIESRCKESIAINANIGRSRRSSKVGSISGMNTEKELTEEAKKKLKESLKLPQDVTDEELLSLNAISENATYSTIKPITHKELNLDSFLNDESNDEETKHEISESISLTLESIDGGSDFFDILLTLRAVSRLGEVTIPFKISNGEILDATSGTADAMEIDSIDKRSRFIKALNLTEDVVKSFTHIYL